MHADKPKKMGPWLVIAALAVGLYLHSYWIIGITLVWLVLKTRRSVGQVVNWIKSY